MKTKLSIKFLFVIALSVFIIYSCGEEEQKQPTPTQTPQIIKSKDSSKTKEEKISKEEKPKENTTKQTDITNPYVVKDGDTLVKIAEKYYNDSSKWFYIFAENEGDINNWNKIYPGQELILPNMDKSKF